MKPKELFEKTKKSLLKVGKRNLIIGCSVLVIGLAIALNFLFLNDTEVTTGYDYSASSGMTSSEDALSVSENDDTNDYFAVSQLNRQRARDEAMEVLQCVADNDTADEEAKAKALDEISQIARDMENESNIETLVVSKGFEQCVAVVSGGTASVIVKADELVDSQISQINEIVFTQTGIEPQNIKIIQK